MSSRVNELKSYKHAPSISSHYKSTNNKASSILSFFTLYQNTFMIFKSIIHKIIDFVWYFFSLIKQHLLFIILPIQSKILHSNIIPMIIELHSSCIDNFCNFVRYYEFKILCSIFITNEETIFNFNNSNQIFFFNFLLLLLLWIYYFLMYWCGYHIIWFLIYLLL